MYNTVSAKMESQDSSFNKECFKCYEFSQKAKLGDTNYRTNDAIKHKFKEITQQIEELKKKKKCILLSKLEFFVFIFFVVTHKISNN